MATVTFDGVTRRYPGATRNAVDALDLEIGDGEFLVLVGPSGCGKTTSLRMLAGLEPVDAGRIRIDEVDVTDVPAEDRDIAMVFQDYALYPHMTVEKNMGFGLRTRRVPKDEIRRRVEAASELLDLGQLLQRRPAELSGGQRQRVAMGRAIVREPKVFLMDEPLSNLDAQLRIQTRSRIAELQHNLGTTTVFVTHDQSEATTMGDRIAVLNLGELQQVGTPSEIYDRPANEFVGKFFGQTTMTVWTTALVEGRLPLGDTSIELTERLRAAAGAGEFRVGVRSEDFRLVADDAPGFPMDVRLVEEHGSFGYLYGTAQPAGEDVSVIVRIDGRRYPAIGDRVRAAPTLEHLHLFDAATGARLG